MFRALALSLDLLAGCDVGKSAARLAAEHPHQDSLGHWFMVNGQSVRVGDEVVKILGTDTCDYGVGNPYDCWVFSLKDGDAQVVTWSDGRREVWTTRAVGPDRVVPVRPDGTQVIGF